MKVERPLDLLNNLKGKRVVVLQRDGKEVAGVLLAFDIHINLALELDSKKPIFIRGDVVAQVF